LSDYRYCPRCAAALGAAPRGGLTRLACPACDWVHWDNPTPVVAALIELGGRVLLARNRAWPEKMFALVTGFLERDETPEAAVAREVAEETGLVTRATHLIGVYDFARRNEVIIAYHVLAEGEVRLGEELADYRLISPERLRPWPMGTGLAMADWLRARGLPVEFLPLPAQDT
jgi:NADH pyrophosphatase NudC (nudix superfamily)